MRSVYFHLVGGASGDMLLASLIDLGCPLSYLKKEWRKLNLDFQVKFIPVKDDAHFLPKRLFFKGKINLSYREIVRVIKNSRLDQDIKRAAQRAYEIIFNTEERVHPAPQEARGVNPALSRDGVKPLSEVHRRGKDFNFRHLGEIDAILEICGFFLSLKYLRIEKIYTSPLPLNFPAKATLEILKGKRIDVVNFPYETITPTAAALLVDAHQEESIFNFEDYGYGWGKYSRDYLVAYLIVDSKRERDKIMKIETNIDDMNPQGFESLFDALYAQKAKEVYLEPVMMKKTRPAFVLNVLCLPEDFIRIKEVIFSHTSTFGIRYQEYLRDKLKYKFIYKNTKLGRIKFRVSVSGFKKEIAEYEDCLRLAKKLNIPLLEVYRQI